MYHEVSDDLGSQSQLNPNNESNMLCSQAMSCHIACGGNQSSSKTIKDTSFMPVIRAKTAFQGLILQPRKQQSFKDAKHKFILDRFRYKECIKFVHDLSKDQGSDSDFRCYCGELESKHYKSSIGVESEADKWSESEDIKTFRPTNAFGQIEFSDSLTQKPVEFVRISDEDRLEDVMLLIKDYWRMLEPEKPNLCISVIGGAKNFVLEGHKKDVFYSGLIQAAHSTKAWIVTSGLNLGIVRVVGDALQDQSFYSDKWKNVGSLRCLGIAPWGYVLNRETLISEDHNTPIRYVLSNFIATGCPVSLNENHTHYIFVDDGRRRRYGGSKSAEYRAKLEKQIALPPNKGGFGIPVVLVIVEGGHDVFIDARNSIIENVPVVICSGTGRAADVLTLAMLFRLKYRSQFSGFSSDEIAVLKEKLLPVSMTPDKVSDALGMIYTIVRNPELITTFDMNHSDDFDLAILSALIKVSPYVEKQLQLAFTWGRSDIAQEKIFRKGRPIRLETLEYFMLKALKGDKLEFVKILLHNGVTMKSFLTVARLQELYNDSDRREGFVKCLKHHNLFPSMKTSFTHEVMIIKDGDSNNNDKNNNHNSNTNNNINVRKGSDQITTGLLPVDDYDSKGLISMSPSQKNRIRLPIINKLLKRMLGNFHNTSYDFNNEKLESEPGAEIFHQLFTSPFEELFLWAVLHQRQKMALYFWECCDNPLILALIACCLYSNMKKSLPTYDTESRALYESYIREFETIAVRLLERCYETDEKLTSVLLERDTHLWGNFNCIHLAAQSIRRKFISSTACQDSLYYAWHQGIRVNLLILLCTLICPPLLFSDRLLEWENTSSLVYTDTSSNNEDFDEFMNNINSNNHPLIHGKTCSHQDSTSFSKYDKIKWKFHAFYSAPRTKFAFNALIYVLFVLYFSYTLLFETLPDKISIHEIIVITYFTAMLIDLIRQIVKSYDKRFEQFHLRWNHYYWNKFDLLLVGLATVSALLRIGLSKTFLYAKSCYVITLIGCYLRIYRLYSHHPRLGPKLVMIHSMLVELLMFLFILVIVLVGYGVSQQVLLYPYRSHFTWTVVRDVFVFPYWNLFGELMLDYAFAEKEGCPSNSVNTEECPTFNFLSPLFLAVYLMIAAILLMNLLIAIFSNVFEKIEENSIELWKFNILSLVLEYSNRPILPVPLSAVITIAEFIIYCLCMKQITGKITHLLNRFTTPFYMTTESKVVDDDTPSDRDDTDAEKVLTTGDESKCTFECYSYTSRLVPDYLRLTPVVIDQNSKYFDEYFKAKQVENFCKRSLLKEEQRSNTVTSCPQNNAMLLS
uniref:LSDAT_euk domain-containing protein n=1 Tax=Trichobilharzia regenti TaxID=157069 RepID=A0AA85KIZ8_TRIRE|nr:unnamed protein product [Trichobilharzia regenti]